MKKRSRKIAAVVGMLFLVLGCGKPLRAFAEVVRDGEAQINFGGDEEIYTVKYDEEGNMWITAEYYSNPNSTLSYHTQRLLIAGEKTDGNPRTAENREEIDVGAHSIWVGGSTSYDTYTISEQYLLEIGKNFFTLEKLAEEEQTVYLNDIFILKRRGAPGEEWVYDKSRYYASLSEIRGAAAWSAQTYEKFRYYYDVPIRLQLMRLKYDVLCIDKETKEQLARLEHGKTLIKGQDIEYLLSDDTLLANGGTYRYTGNYAYGERSGSGGPEICVENVAESGKLLLYFERLPAASLPPPAQQGGSTGEKAEYFNASPEAVIEAEERGAERYKAADGIPSGESVYIAASAAEYLYGYETERISGKKAWEIPYTLNYRLYWEEEGEEKEETGSLSGSVYVTRPYAYTQVKRAECYRLCEAVIQNGALPDGEQTIQAEGGTIPALEFWHSEEAEAHIFPPTRAQSGIVLQKEAYGEGERPEIPGVSNWEIDTLTGNCYVKNDRLVFGGSVVLEDILTEKETAEADFSVLAEPPKSGEDMLYRNGIFLSAAQKNGLYGSEGYVKYERAGQSLAPQKEAVLYYTLEAVNPLNVHTPVYCKAVFESDNARFCELEEPKEGSIPLVLGGDGVPSSFCVSISNTGFHSAKKGYGTANYLAFAARKNGAPRNEVCFPFDVFVDVGNDGKTDDDILIPAGSWYVIGNKKVSMYLPIWVKEGLYTVEFRSVARNGGAYLGRTEPIKNTDSQNYVAVDSVLVQVSGRLYDFTVYRISGSDAWQEIFMENGTFLLKRNKTAYEDGTKSSEYRALAWYDYKAGGKDAVGTLTGRLEKYTLPIFCGSHPKMRQYGTLKGGYRLYYRVSSIGSYAGDGAWLEVLPTFYQVLPDTEEQKKVDLYYIKTENGKKLLVKAGGSADLQNTASISLGSRELGVSQEELTQTARITGEEEKVLKTRQAGAFGVSGAKIDFGLRTFGASRYEQNWYGYYELPELFFAVPEGYDVERYYEENGLTFLEPFFLKEGYLTVQFTLRLHNAPFGILSYAGPLNKAAGTEYQSMWETEGYCLRRTDGEGRSFFLQEGEIAFYEIDGGLQEFKVNGVY